MANITEYLNKINEAVYGEEVRGSIHDSIELINDVGEKVMTVGTAVDSTTSDSSNYYDGSLYLNSTTSDLWKCNGKNLGWVKVACIQGKDGEKGEKGDAGNAGAWVFDTEEEWDDFDKTRMNDGDEIIFTWDSESAEGEGYMEIPVYVGESATGSVHRADTLEGHNTAYFTGLIDEKADATALEGKADKSELNGKADSSSVTTLAERVTALENATPLFNATEVSRLKALIDGTYTLTSATADGTSLELTSITYPADTTPEETDPDEEPTE